MAYICVALIDTDMGAKRGTIEERFWRKVDSTLGHGLEGTCHVWIGALNNPGGYGVIGTMVNGKTKLVYAHRLAFELANGVPPLEMFVCHRCDNKQCVNPNHLFLGTAQDNVSDMVAKGKHPNQGVQKQFCKHGHEFTVENTSSRRDSGRVCKECSRKRQLKRRQNETPEERTKRLFRVKPRTKEQQAVRYAKEKAKKLA